MNYVNHRRCENDGLAVIAADTLTSQGSRRLTVDHNAKAGKIARLSDSYIGVTGSSAHRLVLEHLFESLEDVPQLSTREEIFDLFRRAHPRLKQEYFLNPKDDERDPYESSQMDLTDRQSVRHLRMLFVEGGV